MAKFRILASSSTAEQLVRRIRAALGANASSVEIFANTDGSFEVVAWFDKQTKWSQHTELP
jgi:hypothetical protein